MTQPPSQEPPPPSLASDIPPPEADTSSVMPVLLTILAAYAAYRATKGAVKGPWRAAANTLGLADMAGNALENIARRGLDRQRKAAGRSGDELWMVNEDAVKAGVDAGIQRLVDILKNTPEAEPAGTPSPAGTAAPTVQHGPKPGEVRDLAESIAQTTSNAAQNAAAEGAGWDKIWQSQHDLKVRYSHAFLNRMRVSAVEPFITPDKVPIRFPHDPMAPLDETINCRCSLKWVRASTRKK